MIDYAEVIKEAVSCRKFFESKGLQINSNGFICCPFHGEKTASLKVYSNGRGWCCFGCHKGGDVINLAQLWYHVGFTDAMRQLDKDFNLGLYDGNTDVSMYALSAVQIAQRKAQREKEERQKQAIEAEYLAVFDEWLAADRIIRNYEPRSRDEEFPAELVKALNDRLDLMERLTDLEIRRNSYYEPVRCSEPTGIAVV